MSYEFPLKLRYPFWFRILVYKGRKRSSIKKEDIVFLGKVGDLIPLPKNKKYWARLRHDSSKHGYYKAQEFRVLISDEGCILMPENIFPIEEIL